MEINPVYFYWNTNQSLEIGLYSLRSAEILCLLIHRDLSTLVMFVTGTSSSLRPALLWWEQSLLMLLTELIRSFILSASISLTLPCCACPVSRSRTLTHKVQEHSHSKSHALMTETDWLLNWGIKNLPTHSQRLRSGNSSLFNSFEAQWPNSKGLWPWLSASCSDLWFRKSGICWTN